MKFTKREGINISSIVVQHNILLQATRTLTGREGVLETEKILHLILATVHILSNEDIITICEEDERDLMDIMLQDIEPYFNSLMEDADFARCFNHMKDILLDRCDSIWEEQHSIFGIVDALLTSLSTMSDEEKKEVLEGTAEIAKEAYNKRTEELSKKADEANTKLGELLQQYKVKVESTEENDK